MGLDMYAYSSTRAPAQPVDFEGVEGDSELHYWRKHPDLHRWMEKLYREKGGAAESFNCVNVQLTLDDLERLEAVLHMRLLPQNQGGFFFGASEGDELDDDLSFIAKAKAAIAEGKAVYYTSWW